jgi:hypothetical protein
MPVGALLPVRIETYARIPLLASMSGIVDHGIGACAGRAVRAQDTAGVAEGRRASAKEGTMHNVTDIHVPFPEAVELHLRIRVGACRLQLTRGGGGEWVTGTYDDPTSTLPCNVLQDGGTARITQEPHVAAMLGWRRGIPTFNLALGTRQPYTLSIETGASDTDFELGGVPLRRLSIKMGAGKNVLRFLEPNPEVLSVLDVDAGAGSYEMRNLANAGFADMTLDGGAAAFVCDFGGTLQRDASVHISSGMSTVEIAVPAATSARINAESVLGLISASDGFTTKEGGYWTRAALESAGPVLSIRASVALGTVTLNSY